MSGPDDAALRELAENRGCKLVKSRVRTPGRGDYGRFGLKDAKSGRELFGFGKKGLTAGPGEIEAFLRGNAAATWKTSVGSAKRKKPPAPKPPPPAKPEPKLIVRPARPKDAAGIAALIVSLGYDVEAAEVKRRLSSVETLVADKGGIVGALSLAMTAVLHRPRPVGRISMLVVAEDARGKGIGTALVAEAERRLAAKDCGLIEVTSNRKRLRAHRFYEGLGFERTSYRFVKSL
jgi:ribosomal protein S18 acetylase RimI-like enzyme